MRTLEEALIFLADYIKCAPDTYGYHRAGIRVGNLVSALRSCDQILCKDDASGRLKNLTTCRIRAIFLGVEGDSRRTWDSQLGAIRGMPLSESELTTRNMLLDQAPYHFVKHYRLAVKAIQQIYGYDLQREAKL